VGFPGARVVLALFFAATMALRSNSSMMPSSVAEVVTPTSIFSLANDQQCGRVYDNDDSCAVQEEALETTCSVLTLPPLAPSPFDTSIYSALSSAPLHSC
jgi:predicted permease